MERDDLAWSGQSWRLPLWLWLSVAAMVAGTLHILLDASVGLFPARGTLAPTLEDQLQLEKTTGSIEGQLRSAHSSRAQPRAKSRSSVASRWRETWLGGTRASSEKAMGSSRRRGLAGPSRGTLRADGQSRGRLGWF